MMIEYEKQSFGEKNSSYWKLGDKKIGKQLKKEIPDQNISELIWL